MFKYTSFISYSRAADSRLAPELKSALQNFAKPWYKLRAIQVFCDQTNLTANPDLWSAIEVSLQSSEHFIYLASPQAAQSKWVKKELEAFAGMRSPNIIMVLTDGAILWDDIKNDFDWNSTTAVPKFDQALFSHEPTWIDLTWIRKEQLTIRDPRFLDAVANLSSVLRRIDKDVLIGKDVEEHKKVKRFRLFSIVGLCLLAIFLMAVTVVAVLSERRSQQRLVTTFAGNGNAMLEADDFVMAIPWYVEAMANDRDNNHIEMHETRVRNFMNAVPGLQQVWHTDLPVLKTFFAGNTKLIIISGEPIDWGINEFTCFTNNNGICRVQLQMVDQQTGNEIFKPIKALDGLRQA
ncbi:MAG: toll/interleukin-1 receptor domain-containing protein, partial [Chitinophagaceae bacterium]|nr:toll/interleukin-1 receptor domain-containing protein [Chitinophagaceae bacterium]